MGGKWVGPLPLPDASKCRIRFFPEGRFDFVCGEPDAWTGQGDYRVKGDVLEMEYRWIADKGVVLKDLPQPLRLKLKGENNHVDATLPNGDVLSWDRKL
jgi:hypothetical protein